MTWIDIHTHLNFLEQTPEDAIAAARAVGVEKFITIGTEPKDHETVLELAERFQPDVFCTLGVHPHEASLFTPEVDTWIEEKAKSPRVVAIGEIGLDFYYDNSPRDVQKDAFRRQLDLARRVNLPVEIHTRDAETETVEILKDFEGKVTGVIHCFTGTRWLAEECLKLGFNLSFSGIITFRNADELRDVVIQTPLDRLHVETDAPFLAPVPKRGKKNTPAYMVHTAEKVAELKGISIEELKAKTYQNALRMFPKLADSLASR